MLEMISVHKAWLSLFQDTSVNLRTMSITSTLYVLRSETWRPTLSSLRSPNLHIQVVWAFLLLLCLFCDVNDIEIYTLLSQQRGGDFLSTALCLFNNETCNSIPTCTHSNNNTDGHHSRVSSPDVHCIRPKWNHLGFSDLYQNPNGALRWGMIKLVCDVPLCSKCCDYDGFVLYQLC